MVIYKSSWTQKIPSQLMKYVFLRSKYLMVIIGVKIVQEWIKVTKS